MNDRSRKDWLGSNEYHTAIAWDIVLGLKTGRRGIEMSCSISRLENHFSFISWQFLIMLLIQNGHIIWNTINARIYQTSKISV